MSIKSSNKLKYVLYKGILHFIIFLNIENFVETITYFNFTQTYMLSRANTGRPVHSWGIYFWESMLDLIREICRF